MTERTSIRQIELDDAAELAAIVADSAEHLRPWEPSRPPEYFTVEGQRTRIQQLLDAASNGLTAPFVIVDDGGTIVGTVTLSGITYGAFQSCAMGYWVRRDRLREGHATAGARLAIEYAFDELQLHRVQAETMPDNADSQAVLRKLGFAQYGMAPSYLKINGQWRDALLYQLLNAAVE